MSIAFTLKRTLFIGGLAVLLFIGGLAVLPTTAVQVGEFTNHVGMEFVDVPAGNFVMGSCKQAKKAAFLGEDGGCMAGSPDFYALGEAETPQHLVRVPAFQLGRTEVTLGQFKRFIKATGNSQLVNDDFMVCNAYGDSAPVVYVDWHNAQAFVDWLNNGKPAGDRGRYRLPSEAEWEYAARNLPSGGSLRDFDWHSANSGDHQHPVAGKQPNTLGLYDMNGNVSEWTQDCWNDSYRGAPADGSAWTSGNCGLRGVRGGSWLNDPSDLRPASRNGFVTGIRGSYLGFRVARTVSP